MFFNRSTFITSTHTNYFDRFVKEREAFTPLSPTIIKTFYNLSRLFIPSHLLLPRSLFRKGRNEPAIITCRFALSTPPSTFSRLPEPVSSFQPPVEPIIITDPSSLSRLSVLFLPPPCPPPALRRKKDAHYTQHGRKIKL